MEWLRVHGTERNLRRHLAHHLEALLAISGEKGAPSAPSQTVILIVGVNGTGKTTTAAKLAHLLKREGHSTLLVGADTYRAAGIDQLETWSRIADIPLVYNESARDPSSVIFDGLKAARSRRFDYAIADTSGRLHTSKNLMNEVAKMLRLATTHFPDFLPVTYLTLDANLGQNSLVQAREFNEHIPLDGVILTKMDGTAKGGIIFPVTRDLGIPVVYLGVGETLEDLIAFDPKQYVSSLVGVEDPDAGPRRGR